MLDKPQAAHKHTCQILTIHKSPGKVPVLKS